MTKRYKVRVKDDVPEMVYAARVRGEIIEVEERCETSEYLYFSIDMEGYGKGCIYPIKRQHVEEFMFELKSGMVFQDTSDRYGMFIEVNGALAALYLSGKKRFETYTSNPGSIPDGRRYKKIWQPICVYDLTEQGREYLITTPPIWTNELEKVELTLEEVANKFGIDVERLRIKD